MFKFYRSTSEILHKTRPSDEDINKKLPAEIEERIRRKSKEVVRTEDSRQVFGEAKSIAQNTPSLKRNRSSSYSRHKIFEKAKEVKHSETFHKTLIIQNHTNACLSASTLQYSQYKNEKSKSKMNEVVERKLIISKVLSDMQESKPRLTLRGEIFRNQEEKRKEAELLEPKPRETPKQEQTLLGFSQSKFPSELVYSKQFQNKEEPHRNEVNEEKLKQYSQQLAASIQQSIKKQMEQHYLAKEKQLQEKYIEKEKQYLQKFKNLETVMEAQLEKERKILIETINQQLEKQISKVSQLKQEPKRQKVEELSKFVQQSPRLEASVKTVKQEQAKKQVKQRRPLQSKPAQVANIFNQSEPAQIQEFKLVKQVQAIDRKKSVQLPSTLPPKQNPAQLTKAPKQIKAPLQPPPQIKPNKGKSIYNDADSYLQQIEQITLQKKTSNNIVQRQIQKDRVNQSFNMDKKLNSSFTSERPVASKSKPAQKQLKPPQAVRKMSEQQKAKQELQQRKTYIRNKLKEQIQNDGILIAIGEVAGYCSKFCKKSKVDWRIPSLLLYRYCFDFFRSFKDLYEEARQLNIIKKEELEKYYDYDTVMGANLSKMYKAITKKITLSSVYAEMIESSEIELQKLKPYAIMQAKKYVKELASSSEASPKGGDQVVVQCGLRVINSVFIIKKLNGLQTQLIQQNIEQLPQSQTFRLFQEWSAKLQQEQ